MDKNTKMITINNPNNPTGSWIPRETLEAIRDIAAEADAYVLSDEVYRGISEDGSYMDSIVDIYEKGISVGSMSKIFSLAGLRMGWIASKSQEALHPVSYTHLLSIDEIIALAKAKGVDAIHPGYGFLAENVEFAKACEDNGIEFIGPTAEMMDRLGEDVYKRQKPCKDMRKGCRY